ncbi:protein unc g; protein unc f; protein unc d; prot ein unc b; protein unc a [Trichuris trichiura]|uniref:non-specific serine/threonine protein kinase n=1 Tax=Trichuris trichiura TaxID=36087 RepID=A0A077YYK1_TRITR|nr:protein unc g; protein unc f; protein unc d; prot ein unc b; protein unc a [Trichuris trichiura]
MPGGKAPRFTQKPVIKQTPEGDLLMECLLESYQKPKASWFHGTTSIEPGDRYELSLKSLGKEEYLAALLIKAIQNDLFVPEWPQLVNLQLFQDPMAEDGGTYKCKVSNAYGDSNANINLNFATEEEPKVKPPIFLTKPKIIPKNDGAVILMECRVKSLSAPTATWIHNGEQVTASHRIKISATAEPDNTYLFELELRDPIADDSGLYKCTVKNEAGETNANLTLNFDVPAQEVVDFSPSVAEKPLITTSSDGRSISLQCIVKAKPKPKAVWSRDGITVKESATLICREKELSPNLYMFHLDLLNPTAASAGVYKCTVKNKMGETSANLNLKIDDDSKEEREVAKGAPVFQTRPEPDVTDDQIRIECKVKSATTPTAVWKVGGRLLRQTARISKQVVASKDKGSYTVLLTIKNPEQTDAGQYELVVENKLGKAVSLIDVEIPDKSKLSPGGPKAKSPSPVPKKRPSAKPPVFKHELTTQTIEEGSTAVLQAELDCDPSTKVIWSRNGLQLFSEGNCNISFDGSICQLTLSNIRRQYGGTYECTAESRYGSAKTSCRLVVEPKMSEPIPTIEMQTQDDQSMARTSIATDYSEDEMTESISELRSVSSKAPSASRRYTEPDPSDLSAQQNAGRALRRASLRPGEIAEETLRRRRASSVDVTSESVQELLDKRGGPLMPLPSATEPCPPKITDIPENVTVAEGDSAAISCVIEGNPVPTFRWLRASREIVPGPRFKLMTFSDNNSVALVIVKSRLEDEDAYDLIVENEHGRDQATIKLFVTNPAGKDFRSLLKHRQYEKWGRQKKHDDDSELKAAEGDGRRPSMLPDKKPDYWETGLQDQKVQQGVDKEMKFECTFCKPKAKIRWYKQKQEIFTGMKYKIVNDKQFCTLIINNPDVDDSGKYTCVANGVPTTATLVVAEPPPKYTFEKSLPTSTELIRTREGVLECRVSHPDAPVKWYKAGVEIKPNNPKYKMEVDRFGRCALTVKSVDYDDVGEYMAKINDENFTTCYVGVGNPRCEFISPMKSQKVQEKEDACLECELNDREAVIRWYHDETLVQIDNVKYVEKRIARKRKLLIKNCGLEDEGVYKCMTDDDQTMGQLIVEPLNKFLEKPPDMTVTEKDDVVATCQTKDTRGAATWYRNGKQITPMPGSKFETKSKNGVHTLLIRKVELSDEDVYEVEVGGLKTSWKINVVEAEKKPVFTAKPQTVSAIVGTPVSVTIPYIVKGGRKADPVPTLSRNGKTIDLKKLKDKIKVTVTTDNVIIEFKDPVIADEGKWDLTLTNTAGGTTTNFQMEVKGSPELSLPDPPEGPIEVVDVKAFECKAKWHPSKNTGNTPILYYLVELQDAATGEWRKLGQTKSCELKVPSLIKGQNYKFKVIAVNKVGESGPLIGGEFIAKDPDSKPTLDKVALKNLKVKIGETIKYCLDIGGEPFPSVTWLFGDQLLKLDPRVKIVNGSGKTDFQLTNAQRTDSGKYVIRLKNICGEETGSALVIVVSPPVKPKGPIEVAKVNSEGCTISWQCPEDDGGEPIEEYIVEAQEVGAKDFVEVARCGPDKNTAEITGLKNKGKYKFRVKAKNKEGVSDPLTTKEPVLIKDPWDEPGSPGKPVVTDCDSDRVDLSWTAPKNDGGAPVEKYIIEMKKPSSREWKPVLEATDLTATVTGLTEGEEYQFRVVAVNKAGPGEPSQPSDRQLVKAKFAKPWIDLRSLTTQTVKVGQTARFAVKVGGRPAPTVSWFRGETNPIVQDERVTSKDSKPDLAVLSISSAVRSDRGVYTIVVKNDVGEAKASAELVVIGKPTVPKGPIVVSDVHENYCVLDWQPPDDDGGEPLSHYEVEMMSTDTGRWVTVGKSKSPNLKVEGMKKDKQYQFRVKAVNKEGASDPLTSDETVLARNPFYPPDKPGTPWEPPSNDNGAPITSYIIEKKAKNDTKWSKAGEQKEPICKATVSGLKPNEVYQFRVMAVNQAGPGEPSAPTGRHVAKARFLKPYIDRDALKSITIKVGQNVNFDVPIRGEPPPEVVWKFKDEPIQSSVHITIENEEYRTKFALKDAKRKDAGSYLVTATNSSGTDKCTVDIIVLGKPTPPNGPLEVTDVYENEMTLHWAAPDDDGGMPIEAYEVEKFDVEHGRWIPCGRTDKEELTVHNLVPGHSYLFRVKAVNKEGPSDALSLKEPVLAKNPYDPPAKMDKPNITNWDSDFVELEWKPPSSDGGAPIEKYVIEKKKRNENWQPAMEVQPDQLEAKVGDLVKNEEYQFRVTAVNKAGPGEPSDPSNRVIAKPRFLAPMINRDDLPATSVKIGQLIKFNVHIIGEPPPEVLWEKDGKTVTPNAEISIENPDYLSKFFISKAKRSHSGLYKITATNSSGVDCAEVNVIVLGKPTKPNGPLTVSDVYADHMQLSWNAPDDDGGTPIEFYEVEKCDPTTGIWIPCCRATDTTCTVDGLTEGNSYLFRVKAVNAEGESEPLETDGSVKAKNPYTKPDAPGKPKVTDWDIDHVDLEWQPPSSDGGAPIEEYIVEKRSKYGRWEPAATVPGDATGVKVEDLVPGEEYEFRVTAKNKGGLSEPSQPSEPVIVKHRNLPPKINRKAMVPITIKAGQTISFDVPVEGEPPPTMTWRLDEDQLEPSRRIQIENVDYNTKLTIKNAERGHSGTYTLKAENINGVDVASVLVNVTDKPLAPEGPLEAKEVFADHMTLTWNPPLDDGGVPLSHYVIEAFDPTLGRWMLAAKTPDGNTTEATVPNLVAGRDYKFRVKAQNSNGESEPLETLKPITAKDPYDPPGKPHQVEVVDWDQDFVEIAWQPPLSDGGAPIEGYIVEVKEKFSPFWTKLAETPENLTSFKAEGLTKGGEYQFRVKAKNKAGPGEPSDETEKVITKPRRVAPKFDTERLEDIRLRAGQQYRLELPLAGEPMPKLEFFFNEKPLEPTDRLNFDAREHEVVFVIKRALRTDTGPYKLVAQNEYGQDTVQLNVTVVDHPGPIQNLKVSDVSKNGCKVSWQPPDDDGGAEVSQYVVEKEDVATGRWTTVGETTTCDMPVTGLHQNHEYRMRVKAVNRFGDSEPVVCSESFIARDPFEEPDKMAPPIVVDWDKDHVDLELTKPENDGGAPIEKYVVEMKCNNGEWVEAVEVPADQTAVTVDGLKEGQKYQFRVKAINKAGSGQPSDPSKSVIAKPRRLPPKIDRSTLHDIKIKAGRKLEFDINVEGEPPPKIEWLLNDEPLGSSERTTIANKDYNTNLLTTDVKRVDSGVYRIVATNEYGRDEAEVNVIILDVPAPPRGPLEISDVHKEGCTLAWRPPEDNGGSDILNYVIEKQEEGGNWTECGVAYGTDFQVTKLKPGQEYNFRVKAVNRQGESKPLKSAQSIVAKNPYDIPGKPENVQVVDWDKDHMDLKWEPPKENGGAPIEKYLVEVKSRLDDWKPAVEVPGDSLAATVDGLTPGQSYQFRIRAVNKAGPGQPSDETAPMVAKPRRLAPKLNLGDLNDIKVKSGQPFEIVASFEAAPQPVVTWMREDNKLEQSDRCELDQQENIATLSIYRSERADSGPYTILLFNEFGQDKGIVNVVVLDVPSNPEGPLKVKDMTKSNCNLEWKPPLDDGGSPIMHYVVEKMDLTRGTWQEVGEFPTCQAKVPRLTPGKEYKFRVKAVNAQGESRPLTTEIPVVAKDPYDAASAPEDLKVVDWDRDRVDLAWKPPADDGGSPISRYVVEVREKGNPNWTEAGRTDGNDTSFSVKNLKEGTSYEFRVVAVNDAGPSKPSDPVSATAKPRRLAPKILTQQRQFKVRAGMPLRFDVQFVGEPAPEVHWTKEGNPVLESVQFDNEEGLSGVFFPSPKRADTGPYELRLTNEYGKDQGTFEIIVQDVPGPPEGPLIAVDVTKDSAVLEWHPPLDDGGSEITNYVVEKRDTRSDAWTPVSVFVPGTSTKALKLTEGHSYEFRVMAENAFGRSEPLATTRPVVAKDPFGPPSKPDAPKIKAHDRDFIEIEWKKPLDEGGSPITHYDVERRHNKTGRWVKVNREPVKGLKYQDDHVNEGHLYEYRIVAVNKAGPGEPSDPSPAVYAKPMFEVPKFLLDLNGREVRVKAGEPLDLLIPYIGAPTPEIEWSKEDRPVLSSLVTTDEERTRLFIANSKRSDSGMYKISAKNSQGTADALVKVTVLDKPGEPRGPMTYPAIFKHSIKLQWNPPDDDGGSEIIGYVVEMQQLGSPVWEKIRDYIPSTNYTMKGLEEDRQYIFRVSAENMVGVGEPLAGFPVTAKDPFEVPSAPTAPEVVDYDTDFVNLKWNPPKDDGGSPITGYVIEKHEKKGGGDWSPCCTLQTPLCECKVKNLAEGETYQFRVRAVNLAGEGPPSRASEPCTCQPFVRPPGAPDQPRVGKVTKSSVELTWNRPLRDGGASITGYLVEKKPFISGEWVPCNAQPVVDTNLVVTGLPEGEQFMFRVRAVNCAGPGEPSKPTDNVTIQDQLEKPYIDVGAVKDITVRAGEKFSIRVPYTGGNPKPTASFVNGEQEIFPEESRIQIEVTDDCAILSNLSSVRADTGPYKVLLQNRYGKDMCKLNVKVLDRPGPPTGPLEITNMDADALTLNWLPPKDDGGEEIMNYIVEKKDPATGEWQKVSNTVMGTSYRVRNLKEGYPYEFRVMAENQYGISDPLTTIEPVVPRSQHQPPSAPGIPEVAGTSEDFVNLVWSKPFNDGGLPIQGYIVEKREKGEQNWIRAVFGSVTDNKCKVTSVLANKCYEFRVCAFNAVGNGPFSQNSEPIIAQLPPHAPKIDLSLIARDVYAVVGNPVKINVPYTAIPAATITWSKGSETLESTQRLSIEKAENLTSVGTKSCVRSDSGSYTVTIQNALGSDSATIRLVVYDRPGPPASPLVHSEVTPESCVLSWLPPLDDGGSPVTNYVVEKCRADRPDSWERVTSFARSLSYQVVDLTPNQSYLFRVRAQNEYGTSDPLESEHPVVAKYQFNVPSPPGAPIAVDMDTTWVTLTWDRPDTDGGSKIVGYQIEFREPDSYKWTVANPYLCKENRFTVESLRDQGEYEFRVLAKNAAGLSEPSDSSNVIKLKPKFSPPGPPGSPFADKIGRNYVTLTWTEPITDGGSKITGYIVERREIGSSSWLRCNDYNLRLLEYTVPDLIEFKEYEFRVAAVNSAGRGAPSAVASVKVQEMGGTKPVFVRKLFDRSVPINSQLVLECEAVGRPLPDFRWLRHGREISQVARYTVEVSDTKSTLTISDVWDVDKGEFVCVATNTFGSDTTSAEVKIQEPPSIEKEPGNQECSEGEMIRLKIFFRGDPTFSFELSQNGVDVSAEEGRLKMVEFDDHVLISIPSVSPTDAGRYEFKVRNDSGEATCVFYVIVTGLPGPPLGPLVVNEITQSSAKLSWKPPRDDGGSKVLHYVVERRDLSRQEWTAVASAVKELGTTIQGLYENHEYEFRVSAVNDNGQGPPLVSDEAVVAKFPFDPPSSPSVPDAKVVANDFISVSWDRPRSDGGGRILGYLVEKKEEGIEIWQRCNTTPIQQTNFDVPNLIDGRKYQFRVFAVNQAGTSRPSEPSRPLAFSPGLSAQAPVVVLPLSKIAGEEGRSVRLECEIHGDPKPDIRWFKGAREITDGGKHTIYADGDRQVLVISELFAEDVDEYSCRALNTAGCRSTSAEVVMKSKPRVFIPPSYQTAVEFRKSENVCLKVPFRAYPQASAVWSKDGTRCTHSGRVSTETMDRLAILTIENCTREDSGSYRLQLENDLGSDSCTVEVKVCDRPSPPRYPVVDSVLEHGVSFSWQPPLDDGGSDISGYMVERRRLPNPDWVPYPKVRYCSMVVENLKSDQSYELRVSAENKYGMSDPSNPTAPIALGIDGQPSEPDVSRSKAKEIAKRVRDELTTPSDYDNYVFDIWKQYAPQPVTVKTSPVESQYEMLEEIGSGAFGQVVRCVEKSTGNVFAAKLVKTSTPAEKETVRKEIDIMNQLRHPKLIHLHDAFDNDDTMVMIYEFMSGGELFEKVSDDQNHMTEEEAIKYIRQVCEGLQHMHERNVVHLDIKPENIMFASKRSNDLKLIDFGLAAKLNPDDMVKVTTGTAEFAAPEIIDMKPVGFYTDMWAVGVLSYVLLSGLSPFGGETDMDTLKNVKNCDWDFDATAFRDVSDEAKDFIKKLLVRDPNARLTVQQCLEHPWLKGDVVKPESLSQRIAADRYYQYRDSIRKKYADWPEPNPPLGRIAHFSSLRKLEPSKYHIQDTFFDRREAQPRFVIKPVSTTCIEGQSTSFYCRVIADSPAVISWCRDDRELKQSVKYMKKYQGNDYTLTINRTRLEDRGEYVVRAKNAYGTAEEVAFLNVQKAPEMDKAPERRIEKQSVTRASPLTWSMPVWTEPDVPPTFTFHLRSRLIQLNHQCKLLCCVSGKPQPTVTWTKDGVPVDKDRVSLSYRHGVCSMEIYGVKMEDAGRYTCEAENSVGKASTSCVINVQGKNFEYFGEGFHLKVDFQYDYRSLYADSDVLKSQSDAQILTRNYRYSVSEKTTERSAIDDSILSIDSVPPSFSSPLKDISVNVGQPAVFKCSVEGSPKPRIRWLKNGEEVPATEGRFELSSEDGTPTLRIADTAKTDEAEYCCEATNQGGFEVSKAWLRVLDVQQEQDINDPTEVGSVPSAVNHVDAEECRENGIDLSDAQQSDIHEVAPKIISDLVSIIAKENETITLECQIEGIPTTSVWFRNGKELKESESCRMLNDGNRFKLILDKAKASDSGTYQFEISSPAGSVSTACTLLVEGDKASSVPRVKKLPQSCRVQEGSPAKLTIEFEDISNITVQWFHDSEKVEKTSRVKSVKYGNTFKLEIKSTEPSDSGFYVVKVIKEKKAISKYGASLHVVPAAV